MKIVSSDQMRQIEARSESAGVSTDALMEQAGLAVAKRVRHHVGRLPGARVLVMVGPGNNGGDGLVAARHLDSWGAHVVVYLCLSRRQPDPKLDIARQGSLTVLDASRDEGREQLRKALESSPVVVDAVLGTGRARPIEGPLKSMLQDLADARSKRPEMRVLALDLPSGLDADTAAADPVCPTADVTVCLGHPKVGLFGFPGADRVGRLEVVDIGLPANAGHDVTLGLMTPEWARTKLPARPLSAHKGTFGRTLVVAGSRNYVGAAYLASAAATRVGAGLVTVATPQSLIPSLAARAVEPTYVPLPETSFGLLSADAAQVVMETVGGYDALLVGCGMGQSSGARDVVEHLLDPDTRLPPTVVDADGLNILAKSNAWWERFSFPAVVTPHPGEMARLRGQPLEDLAQDERLSLAVASAAAWNKVTILKGAYSLVAFPDGNAMQSPFANPGLASAGTGDVLAGTIAGLLSQGCSLEDAASLGVYLHGMAGEVVRDELGDAGMVASDLLPALPRAIKALQYGLPSPTDGVHIVGALPGVPPTAAP